MSSNKFNLEIDKLVKENINRYCKKNNITLKKLLELAEISADDYQKRDISIVELYKISIILKVNINNFFIDE